MKIYQYDITFNEVPNEVSLTFFVAGCKLNCPGCSWKKYDLVPEDMDLKKFTDILVKNSYPNINVPIPYITFLGGEWEPDFEEYLKLCELFNFKICLYTGLELDELNRLNPNIVKYLTYLKTGRWIEKLGGLNSPTTNQKLIKLK